MRPADGSSATCTMALSSGWSPNAAKHAHASVVHVNVEAADNALGLRVRDDGSGGADPALGTGLVGLKDRVEALGGTITVHSPVGAGTSLRADFPLPA
jgi:signal transduction histidine kinase